ncbi:MAG TPA: tetratricopeptide repeat protein, partial [Acidobacteriota bacterium]|nr:tetratricopeptide repeat protein [Acidobacteriota bacterium]
QRARAILAEARRVDDNLEQVWAEVDVIDGKYKEAIERLKGLRSETFDYFTHFYVKDQELGRIYQLTGDQEASRKHCLAALKILEAENARRPKDARVLASLGLVYARLGEKEKAVIFGKLAVDSNSADKVFLSHRIADLAEIYVLAGQQQRAINSLDELLSKPAFFSVRQMGIDPRWKSLRNQPAFQKLLQKYSV